VVLDEAGPLQHGGDVGAELGLGLGGLAVEVLHGLALGLDAGFQVGKPLSHLGGVHLRPILLEELLEEEVVDQHAQGLELHLAVLGLGGRLPPVGPGPPQLQDLFDFLQGDRGAVDDRPHRAGAGLGPRLGLGRGRTRRDGPQECAGQTGQGPCSRRHPHLLFCRGYR
jgi:hypothetical protein